MANNVTGVFESLVVPAATDVKLTSKYRNRFLDCVYNDYKGLEGKIGQTVQINVPTVNVSNVTDIGNGPIVLSDTAHTPVSLVINHKPSSSRRIQSFDQCRTPLEFQQLYLQPVIEEVLRWTNAIIAGLFNPTNFASYATIAGGTNVFTRLNISQAWTNVAGTGGAPVNPNDSFFLTDQVPYGNMLGDATQNFIQQFVVGESAAVAAQQSAKFMPQFDAQVDWDQQTFTATTGKHGGIYFHRMAVGMTSVLEPKPDDSYVRQITVFPTQDKLFPVTLQFWHDPSNQGHVLHAYSVFGCKVIKPDWGSYCETV